VLFDQIAFKNEGLRLRGRKDVVEPLCAIHHQGGFVGQFRNRPEIGKDPFFEILGLAHIDDSPGRIFEQICSRAFRQGKSKGVRV